MIPEAWRTGEVAVLGLARSGTAATRLLRARGVAVYASDRLDTSELRERAASLRAAGAAVDTGGHDLERIGRARAAIVSPGIPPSADVLLAARAAGVPVLAELDLGLLELAESRVVAVTGTNGKTTTTTLIAHLLATAGLPAVAGGNVGTPLTEIALTHDHPAWIVVEASSFQLHDAPHLAPAVGVITNLAPDHLDRYVDVEEYFADKARLFQNAVADSVWVLNAADAPACRLAGDAPGHRRYFTVAPDPRRDDVQGWYDRAAQRLMLGDVPLVERTGLQLLGDHNVANALAAALAGAAVGIDPPTLGAALATFQPLPHRLEPVAEHGGVLWINDSKATSVAATQVALQALDRPLLVLLGGFHKGQPYTALGPTLAARSAKVVAYGAAADRIVHDLRDVDVTVYRATGLDEAVVVARRHACPGSAVLLSPACSSYDAYSDYEQRGEHFRRLVHACAR